MKRQVETAHRFDIKFIKHTDGNVLPLLPDMAEIVDGVHSLDPSAGVDIGKVKEEYGDSLVLMGNVSVDEDFCGRLLRSCNLAKPDEDAHLREHSAEVQIPFLQAVNPNVRIVPVIVSSGEPMALQEFGRGLAGVIKKTEGEVLVVASSDMTHYESQESARKKDKMAIDMITSLNEAGLLSTVAENNITMCGAAPTATMLACCNELGADEAGLVRYQTSGDITGDFLRVVGYAAIIVK